MVDVREWSLRIMANLTKLRSFVTEFWGLVTNLLFSFQKDPREKAIPPRPRGQRSEPENTGGANNFFNFGGGGGNNGFQGRHSY